ncbi:MAG TPA: hypothetical protein VJ124_08875 [Pyrinomonadaceae bacterium]|nr:hypothetical protein [Pyrinomonadaceae bacterium]
MRALKSLDLLVRTVLIAGFLSTFPVARAQEGSGSDAESSEVRILKQQKAVAELRQAIAEARKAELDARYPAAKSDLLEGKTVVSGGLIEGQIVAYFAITEAAEMIAQTLHQAYPNIKILVIHNEKDANLLSSYGAAMLRLDALKNRYEQVLLMEKAALAAAPRRTVRSPVGPPEGRPKSFPLVLGAATSAAGSLLDLLAPFRTDVNLEGKTFDVDDEDVLVSEIFRAVRAQYQNGIVLYYPAAIAPNLESVQASALLARLEDLYELKDEAEALSRRINENSRKKTNQLAGLDELSAETEDPAPYEEDKRVLEDDLSILNQGAKNLQSVTAQFDILLKDLLKTDERSGFSLLTDYLRTENLVRAMNGSQNECFWLTLGIIKAGGNQRTERNLFLDLFRSGSKVSHNGGALVKYHLYDRNGVSRFSGTAQKYIGYMSSKEILKRLQ